jgi:hypothetical protein
VCGVLVAFDGAVDGGAGDAEQLGELCAGVLAGVVEGDEVRLLPRPVEEGFRG